MPDFSIRPTLKAVYAVYLLALILALAAAAAAASHDQRYYWLLVLPGLLVLWNLPRHLARLFIKLSLEGSRLRFERGVFSRATRALDLAKIQDVRVDQTLGQRMLNIGDLSLETAGESGPLRVPSIDDPHGVADRILDLAKRSVAPAPGTP